MPALEAQAINELINNFNFVSGLYQMGVRDARIVSDLYYKGIPYSVTDPDGTVWFFNSPGFAEANRGVTSRYENRDEYRQYTEILSRIREFNIAQRLFRSDTVDPDICGSTIRGNPSSLTKGCTATIEECSGTSTTTMSSSYFRRSGDMHMRPRAAAVLLLVIAAVLSTRLRNDTWTRLEEEHRPTPRSSGEGSCSATTIRRLTESCSPRSRNTQRQGQTQSTGRTPIIVFFTMA